MRKIWDGLLYGIGASFAFHIVGFLLSIGMYVAFMVISALFSSPAGGEFM